MSTKFQNKHKVNFGFTILFMAIFLTLPSCHGNTGKAGVTPTITVAGAQCTNSGGDLLIVIANGFNASARVSEYTSPEGIDEVDIQTQLDAIYCMSGDQVWFNSGPVVIAPKSTTITSLSCGSLSIRENNQDSPVGCNIQAGQPIECYMYASMTSTTEGLSVANISTLNCVPDIKILSKLAVDLIGGGAT